MQFSASATKSLPISAKFGTDFSVSGTVNVATTLSESLSVGAYWVSEHVAAGLLCLGAEHARAGEQQRDGHDAGGEAAHLGFIDLNVSAGSAVFSPVFTFALTDPSPDGPAGRVTTAELTTGAAVVAGVSLAEHRGADEPDGVDQHVAGAHGHLGNVHLGGHQ